MFSVNETPNENENLDPGGDLRIYPGYNQSVDHIQLSNIKPNHMCLSHIFWIMTWTLKWLQTG